MSKDAASYLGNLDLATLEALCGRSIVLAVRSRFRTNVESQLAAVLALKLGFQVFDNEQVRLAVLDSLPNEQTDQFCQSLGLTRKTRIASRRALLDYFRSYNQEKSKQFVDFLQLSKDYYRNDIQDDRAPSVHVNVEYGQLASLKPYLHPFQKRVKDQVFDHIDGNGSRFVVQMPTGAGKTYTALEAVVDHLRSPKSTGYVVWLVASNELAEQAFETFRDLWLIKGDRPLTLFRLFQIFQPEFVDGGEGVVFAGFDKFHSILSNRNHSHYQSLRTLIKNSTVLIVDEAHTSVAETYEDCINAFILTDTTDVIGLTATPGRTDPSESEDLKKLYTNDLIRVTDQNHEIVDDPVGYLQQRGYLAKLTYETFETGLEFRESDKKILEALACSTERNAKILEQMERAVELNHSTLVFSCTKDHAYALLVLCKSKNILAEVITGDVPQSVRLEILERFKRREFLILINQNILSTGIDVPNIDRIIVCPPIGSKILYSQILGRALRGPKNGGNERNTVVGIKDNLLNYPSAQLIYESFANEWGQ